MVVEPKRTAKADLGEGGKETPEKARFSSFKALVERVAGATESVFAVLTPRSVKATATAMAVAFAVSCGDTNEQTDADADPQDTIEAVDSHEDAGVDEAAPDEAGPEDIVEETAPSLCEMYPEGDPHRVTFRLNEQRLPEGSDMALRLTEMDADDHARFLVLPIMDFMGFHTGDQVTRDMYPLGATTFEECGRTALACSGVVDPPTGDVSCTATLASDRVWRSY